MTKIRQDSKEAYEKYAGKVVNNAGKVGIVCGYDTGDANADLIIAVQNDTLGWFKLRSTDILVSHQENPNGYWYVQSESIADYLQEKEENL